MSSFTEEFATKYAQNAVPDMLKAIYSIKRYNRFVLLGALATSYLHQAHYLLTQKAGYFAYLVPLIFDAAMVSMLIIVRTPGISRDAKRGALVVFAGTALLSATVNFLAPGSLGLRFIFALVVVLVIGVELVAGRIRPDFAAIEKQATELLSAAHDIKNKTAEAAADLTNLPAAHSSAAATAPAMRPVAQPASTQHPPSSDIPMRLLPAARITAVRHRQATGEPITADQLADRLNTTPATAAQLLAAIDGPTPAPINGNTPALAGEPR